VNESTNKKLIIIAIVVLSAGLAGIFLIDWLDKNLINPRIWEMWNCDKMKDFALKKEDEKLTDFQQARFHEDLSLCMGT